MVRYAYVTIISPAAFLAVVSGTGLIFGQQTYSPWLSFKLLFVCGLVVLHVMTGLVIIRLFKEGGIYPIWRFVVVTLITSAVALTIIFIGLSKPFIDPYVTESVRPGGLRILVERFSPWPIP
jgi:protoporphyrinogen IX oxidase